MAASGGLLQSGGPSLYSQMCGLRVEFAESLRPPPRIFPFSGELTPETGFDRDCMAGAAFEFGVFSVIAWRPLGPWRGLQFGNGSHSTFGRFAWRGVQRL